MTLQPIHPDRNTMKRQLSATALFVCPVVVAAQRAGAALAPAQRGNGFDGAHPGAPVP